MNTKAFFLSIALSLFLALIKLLIVENTQDERLKVYI